MDHEEPQLVGGRPVGVAGLAAASLDRLPGRALDRYDDIAQVEPRPRRQEERPGGG